MLAGPSHAARKDLTSAEETVVSALTSTFVFMVTVVMKTMARLFIKAFICQG